jgi:hypothetical protein
MQSLTLTVALLFRHDTAVHFNTGTSGGIKRLKWKVDLTNYGLSPETRAYMLDRSRCLPTARSIRAMQRPAFILNCFPGTERPGATCIKPAPSYCMTGIFSRPLDKHEAIKSPVHHGAAIATGESAGASTH